MWQWLKSWFERRDADGYRPSERLIYVYSDGEKIIRADPATLYRRLMNVWPILRSDWSSAETPSEKFAEPAAERFFRQVCDVFGVQRWDGSTGLTETELQELVEDFTVYCDRIKKKLKLLAIRPEVISPATASAPDAEPATNSGLASCSTDNGLSTGNLEPSPTA